MTLLLVFGLGIIAYASVATDLPPPGDLSEEASDFQSMRIFDRNGNLLNESFDPNMGRRTYVSLDSTAESVIEATIATEDANFYEHAGVDPVALVRALYYAVQEREFVSGASTIPQQLVKMVLLTPERSLQRKVQEAVLAAEVSRRYSKEEILELYLNEIYYGNLAYGIDAAADLYFDKDASELSLAESALLAGLPQAPAYYDPYRYEDRAKNRQAVVLGLMVENELITPAEADEAWMTPLNYSPLEYDLKAPHFTLYVREQLEALLETGSFYKVGLRVTTTLDQEMQEQAQQIVREQVAALADRNATNGALIAMHPETGEILAMVGSADFDSEEIDGQVNMALAPRQPGSAIKPLVYLAAFEQQPPTPNYTFPPPLSSTPDQNDEQDGSGEGPQTQPAGDVPSYWTPGTLLADIIQEFPDGANEPYVPTNYDDREHGIVTVRSALANSYNIPAVRMLQTVGIEQFINFARTLGITTLTRPDYGLSLSLGGGEIPLLELTGAFSVIANQGVYQPPLAVRKIEDNQGRVYCEQGTDNPCRVLGGEAAGQQLIRPQSAYLMSTILSDNAARTPAFGPNSALYLGERTAAAKTGTTNDYRDSLTVGYTPQLVTGVWVGNTDYTPMDRVAGSSGAAQLWNRFMHAALDGQPIEQFNVPDGIQTFEICADTGTQPSQACPERIQFPFAVDRPPLPPQRDLWQVVRLDRVNGNLATTFTPQEAVEERVFKIYPEEYRTWAENHDIPQPPREESDVFQFEPQVSLQQPAPTDIVQGVVTVIGSANVPGFANYELQYGVSHNPGAFSPSIWGPVGNPVENNVLGQWDTTGLTNGPHTLRLVVRDQFGTEYNSEIPLFVENTEPVVELTATWTPTSTPVPEQPAGNETLTPTPTWTPEVIQEAPPTLTPTPTWTPEVIQDDTPTPTSSPTSTTEPDGGDGSGVPPGVPVPTKAPPGG